VKYIATQAPLETSEFDFFQMVFEQDSSIIVALANPVEQNRVKGIPYWKGDLNVERELQTYACSKDDKGLLIAFPSNFFVTLVDETIVKPGKLIIRQLKMRNKDKVEKIVIQIHYIDWPDFGVPPIEDFDLILTSCRQYYSRGSTVVTHCSAGVGRTGVFIAVDAVLQILKSKEKTNLNLETDLIYDTIVRMRKCRYGMVQTPKQLLAIYLAVEKALEKEANANQSLRSISNK
jgi:protein tyrosine phosphatase